MANITFDFGRKEQEKGYPSHGWAVNSQNIKLLWLPLLRLIEDAGKIREQKGIENKLTLAHTKEIRSFHDLVEKLFLSLRELHRTTSFVVSCGGFANPKNDTEGVGQTIPLYVDLVYMYLRRLSRSLY